MTEQQSVAPETADAPLDGMMQAFANEQQSNEVLFERTQRDRGWVKTTEGGTVTMLPSGYGREEMRRHTDPRSVKGRASSVMLWTYDGRPSETPIAYQAGGTNPSISRYLRKRHCNACSFNGFITMNCSQCGSPDTIQLLYTSYAAAPRKRDWYGQIPCLCSVSGEMGGDCPRDGVERNGVPTGFLSLQQMLMHASSKHRQEFAIWQTMRQGGGIPTRPQAPAQPDVDSIAARLLEDPKFRERLMEKITAPAKEPRK